MLSLFTIYLFVTLLLCLGLWTVTIIILLPFQYEQYKAAEQLISSLKSYVWSIMGSVAVAVCWSSTCRDHLLSDGCSVKNMRYNRSAGAVIGPSSASCREKWSSNIQRAEAAVTVCMFHTVIFHLWCVCLFCLWLPFQLGCLFIRGHFQPNRHNCANTNLIWFLHFVIACKTGKWWQHRAIWMELKQQLCVIWKSTRSFNFNPILTCGILKSFKHLSNRKLLDGDIQLMHFKGPK